MLTHTCVQTYWLNGLYTDLMSAGHMMSQQDANINTEWMYRKLFPCSSRLSDLCNISLHNQICEKLKWGQNKMMITDIFDLLSTNSDQSVHQRWAVSMGTTVKEQLWVPVREKMIGQQIYQLIGWTLKVQMRPAMRSVEPRAPTGRGRPLKEPWLNGNCGWNLLALCQLFSWNAVHP